MIKIMRDPRNELAELKYILACVYDELRKRACQCEYCDDCSIAYSKLKSMMKESGFKYDDLVKPQT